MKNKLLLLSFITLSVVANAQSKKVFEWEPKPTLHKIPATYNKESAVIIENDVNLEYRSELKDIYVYRSIHRIVKVIDEKGIEAFNKFTIPMTNGKTIEFIKARTILPGGKVIEIGRDKVKEIKNEEGVPQYLFAMEGVEKNAEVELQYTEKKPLALFGAELFQFSIPVMQASFSLSTPENMVFRIKGYNGFGTAKDTLIDGTRYYEVSHSSIPAIHEEAYSDLEANQMRVEYKLNYMPKEKPDVRMLTWTDLAKQLYKGYYDFSSKEKRAVEKYLAQLEVNSNDAEVEKIKKIEEGIKTEIVFNKDLSGDDAKALDKVIANKTANEEGYARLFAACFTLAGVQHEFGLSSNRFEHPLDEDFENWNYLETYVFYFPAQKQFLAPSYIYYRYPVVPASLITNKAILSKVTEDDAVADIRTITPLPLKESENNITANVSFTGDDLDPQVEVTHTFSGYSAMGIREAIVLLPKDKQKETIENIVNLSDKPEDVLTYKTANSAFHNYYDNKPLKLMATLRAPQLMEKAGPKYLFKLGDVIGRQQEMYQDTKRELPVSIAFPHSENRSITVNIPAGYKVLNPDAIRIHQDDKNANGSATMGFDSDYKIDGDKLYVNIKEYYSGLSYPVSYYETFRKVINASADFNKVVLVMVKQ